MGKKVIMAELAEIMGVNRSTLSTYRKSHGMPVVTGGGAGKQVVCDTEEIMNWWLEYKIRQRFGDIDKNEDYIDREYEQGRLAKAQADGKEIENDIKRGNLLPADIITKVLSNVTSQIAAVLDSIPQKVKRRVPSLTSRDVEIIKKEIIKTQNAAANVEVDLEQFIDN